jgi:hypothetical protein
MPRPKKEFTVNQTVRTPEGLAVFVKEGRIETLQRTADKELRNGKNKPSTVVFVKQPDGTERFFFKNLVHPATAEDVLPGSKEALNGRR